jgi:hypothetical protein
VLDDLADASDALSHPSLAETGAPAGKGESPACRGMLDAVSRGERPPEPEVTTTPRRDFDLTHRVIAVFAADPPMAHGWRAVGPHPRVALEPCAGSWLSGRLPSAEDVICRLHFTRAGSRRTTVVSLESLDIGPLDLLSIPLTAAPRRRAGAETAQNDRSGSRVHRCSRQLNCAYSAGPANSSGPATEVAYFWRGFQLTIMKDMHMYSLSGITMCHGNALNVFIRPSRGSGGRGWPWRSARRARGSSGVYAGCPRS